MPRWTEESRRQYSDLMKSMPRSQEWKDNISRARKGKPGRSITVEQREKISVALRGRSTSPEHARHLSEALIGQKLSEERCRRMSESRRGRTHTAETRRKMSLAHMSRGDKRKDLYKNSGGIHAGVWMRCLNSEGVFARQLDEAKIKWLYEPRRFRLSIGSYLPDFFLPEFNVWVEVKGYFRVSREQEKIEAFRRETGKCLIVVRQSELESRRY